MKAAQIKDGKVDNIIMVDSLDALPDLVDADGANMGDLWDGTTFTHVPKVLTPEELAKQELKDKIKDKEPAAWSKKEQEDVLLHLAQEAGLID